MFSDSFSKDNSLVKADLKNNKFLACALMLRGNVEISDIRRNIEKLKNLPQKSLESSKNVLRQRQYIEEDIIDFKKKLDEGLEIMHDIESTRVQIQKNEQKIKDSKNFTYTVKVAKYKEVPLKPGIHTTNCLTCNNLP